MNQRQLIKGEELMNEHHEFNLSRESIIYMSTLASRVGINLENYKEEVIYNRLVRRLRELKLNDFDEYCYLLRIDVEEEVKFVNLITNITTFFFRENEHYNFLVNKAIPELLLHKSKIRIWSAACSTGEEPYTISMVLHEKIPNIDELDIKILATDVNTDALTRARAGVYDARYLKDVSDERLEKWFKKVDSMRSAQVVISDKLKKMITFNELNLLHLWPFRTKFDVIFCRNVLMYFQGEIRTNILQRLTNSLNIGGYLILGYSETLEKHESHYVFFGKSIYKKVK